MAADEGNQNHLPLGEAGRGCGEPYGFTPVAHFRSPFTSKFGLPRQSGVLEDVEGEVVFCKPYDNPDAIRGIEGFSHLWLLWEFSANKGVGESLTVRPPRLGGNTRIGVFASRSPFRPNGIGLSCVRLKEVRDGRLIVLGADLMDGTPIYDVKPYVAYADAHPDAVSGFTDTTEWQSLDVIFPEPLQRRFTPSQVATIIAALRQDPRPHYHHDPERIYGMPFAGYDIRFRVHDGIAEVCHVIELT